MPMIATTTRCPSCRACGSSARTAHLGDVEARSPPADELLGDAELRDRALDDGLQRPARRLLDQQLGRLAAGDEDAVDVLVLDGGARGGLVVQLDDLDVDVDASPCARAPAQRRSPTTPTRGRCRSSSTTCRPRVPMSSTMMTIELMMKFLSRTRAEISRPATSGPAPRCRGVARLGHAATWSGWRRPRGTARRGGRGQAKCVTRPVRRAAASTHWSSVPRASSSTVSPACSETTRTPGRPPPSAARRRGRRRAAAARRRGAAVPRSCRWRPSGRGRGCPPSRRAARPVELVAGEDDGTSVRHCSSSARRGSRRRPGPGPRRLVEDKHVGLADQRGSELDPLLVAEGELLHLRRLGARRGRAARSTPRARVAAAAPSPCRRAK